MNQVPLKDFRRQMGGLFRQRRLEMKLSFKEIENATSIRALHLQAIEEGEIFQVLSLIYVQGFIKQYAAYLGLDGDKIIQEHAGAFPRSEKQEFDYGIGTLEVRNMPGSGVRSLPNLLWLLSFALALILAWFLARHFALL